VREGVVVTPSLPLRDAAALSKDLAADGWKVQVPYADRAAATSALKALEGKGPARIKASSRNP
jgi:hypothetical protein